jgi:hypothetical protein
MMDKPSERKADSKKYGDVDIGITKFGPYNERQSLKNMWEHETITGGSVTQRLANNDYCKVSHEKYEKNKNNPQGLLDMLLENADTRGPPLLNISQPKRVL